MSEIRCCVCGCFPCVAAEEKAFVLLHHYSDGSGHSVIYVGADKAKAFDALIGFLDKDPSQGGSGISMHRAGEYQKTEQECQT